MSEFGDSYEESLFIKSLRTALHYFVIELADRDEERTQRTEWQRPTNAKALPGCQLGDRLYMGCLDDGFAEYIAVQVRPDQTVMMVRADDTRDRPIVYWAWSEVYPSLAEAIKAAAESDVDYHSKHLRLAQQALEALASGADLSSYLEEPASDD